MISGSQRCYCTDRPPYKKLLDLAQAEIASIVVGLPDNLCSKAQNLPVCFEPKPTSGMRDDNVTEDTLGLFCGEALNDPSSSHPVPNQIFLFIENIWDYAQADKETYLEEIQTTYKHELGHYLGFDEDDLAMRDLD